MKRPVIKPKRDEPTPCEGHSALFLSASLADHASARILCRGSKRLDVPPCPFIGWCEQERLASAREHGATAVEGTWHGVLFVDGRPSRKGRKTLRVSA